MDSFLYSDYILKTPVYDVPRTEQMPNLYLKIIKYFCLKNIVHKVTKEYRDNEVNNNTNNNTIQTIDNEVIMR